MKKFENKRKIMEKLQALLSQIKSIKKRAFIGIITTTNNSDSQLINKLENIEKLIEEIAFEKDTEEFENKIGKEIANESEEIFEDRCKNSPFNKYPKFPKENDVKTIENIIRQYPKTDDCELQTLGELRDWQIKELHKLFDFKTKIFRDFIENIAVQKYPENIFNMTDLEFNDLMKFLNGSGITTDSISGFIGRKLTEGQVLEAKKILEKEK